MIRLKVADKLIRLDIPDRFIGEYMHKFMYTEDIDVCDTDDVTIEMLQGQIPELPDGAVKDVDVPVHTIYSHGEQRFYVRTIEDYVTYFKYNADCTHFVIYFNDSVLIDESNEVAVMDVSSVLRRIFIMIIAAHGGINLHSASLLCNGNAVIFSATSGTGKTTHSKMWKSVFPDIKTINGDNGYCVAEEDGVYIYGAPWCGTSGECMNIKAPIRAIVFLEQAPENSIRELDAAEAFIRITAGCFLPAWDKDLMAYAIATTERIATNVRCYLLKCLPDHNAARTAYNAIFK